jgi:hypothetical protein
VVVKQQSAQETSRWLLLLYLGENCPWFELRFFVGGGGRTKTTSLFWDTTGLHLMTKCVVSGASIFRQDAPKRARLLGGWCVDVVQVDVRGDDLTTDTLVNSVA